MAKDGTKKTKLSTLKAKFFGAYYGHPIKDMKLICVAGANGKVEVANFVHEILKCAGQPVAILASENEIKIGSLHKFLSSAWKVGSNYVIVTAPAKSIEKGVFYGLPIHIAALTNSEDGSAEHPNADSELFQMSPDFVILNRDDAKYQNFADFAGTSGTITYGSDRFSNIQIEHSKLYKKGSEANLAIGNVHFTVASFLSGEPTISYLAAATAIADALHVTPEKITEGIANYDPEGIGTQEN